MLFGKFKFSALFKAIALTLACLFLVNDLAWATPQGYNPSLQATLAAESRFNRITPFFSKYGLGFENMADVIYAAQVLKKLFIDETSDEIERERAINKLNARTFSDGAVKIRRKIGIRKVIGNEYEYIVLDFAKGDKTTEVLFLKGYNELAPAKQAELRKELKITDEEKHHLGCTGLEEVWFINRGTETAKEDAQKAEPRPAATPAKFAKSPKGASPSVQRSVFEKRLGEAVVKAEAELGRDDPILFLDRVAALSGFKYRRNLLLKARRLQVKLSEAPFYLVITRSNPLTDERMWLVRYLPTSEDEKTRWIATTLLLMDMGVIGKTAAYYLITAVRQHVASFADLDKRIATELGLKAETVQSDLMGRARGSRARRSSNILGFLVNAANKKLKLEKDIRTSREGVVTLTPILDEFLFSYQVERLLAIPSAHSAVEIILNEAWPKIQGLSKEDQHVLKRLVSSSGNVQYGAMGSSFTSRKSAEEIKAILFSGAEGLAHKGLYKRLEEAVRSEPRLSKEFDGLLRDNGFAERHFTIGFLQWLISRKLLHRSHAQAMSKSLLYDAHNVPPLPSELPLPLAQRQLLVAEYLTGETVEKLAKTLTLSPQVIGRWIWGRKSRENRHFGALEKFRLALAEETVWQKMLAKRAMFKKYARKILLNKMTHYEILKYLDILAKRRTKTVLFLQFGAEIAETRGRRIAHPFQIALDKAWKNPDLKLISAETIQAFANEIQRHYRDSVYIQNLFRVLLEAGHEWQERISHDDIGRLICGIITAVEAPPGEKATERLMTFLGRETRSDLQNLYKERVYSMVLEDVYKPIRIIPDELADRLRKPKTFRFVRESQKFDIGMVEHEFEDHMRRLAQQHRITEEYLGQGGRGEFPLGKMQTHIYRRYPFMIKSMEFPGSSRVGRMNPDGIEMSELLSIAQSVFAKVAYYYDEPDYFGYSSEPVTDEEYRHKQDMDIELRLVEVRGRLESLRAQEARVSEPTGKKRIQSQIKRAEEKRAFLELIQLGNRAFENNEYELTEKIFRRAKEFKKKSERRTISAMFAVYLRNRFAVVWEKHRRLRRELEKREVSLDAEVGAQEGSALRNIVVDEGQLTPQTILSISDPQMKQNLESVIDRTVKDGRSRVMVMLRLGLIPEYEGITLSYQDIANIVGFMGLRGPKEEGMISVEGVQQNVQKSLELVANHLNRFSQREALDDWDRCVELVSIGREPDEPEDIQVFVGKGAKRIDIGRYIHLEGLEAYRGKSLAVSLADHNKVEVSQSDALKHLPVDPKSGWRFYPYALILNVRDGRKLVATFHLQLQRFSSGEIRQVACEKIFDAKVKPETGQGGGLFGMSVMPHSWHGRVSDPLVKFLPFLRVFAPMALLPVAEPAHGPGDGETASAPQEQEPGEAGGAEAALEKFTDHSQKSTTSGYRDIGKSGNQEETVQSGRKTGENVRTSLSLNTKDKVVIIRLEPAAEEDVSLLLQGSELQEIIRASLRENEKIYLVQDDWPFEAHYLDEDMAKKLSLALGASMEKGILVQIDAAWSKRPLEENKALLSYYLGRRAFDRSGQIDPAKIKSLLNHLEQRFMDRGIDFFDKEYIITFYRRILGYNVLGYLYDMGWTKLCRDYLNITLATGTDTIIIEPGDKCAAAACYLLNYITAPLFFENIDTKDDVQRRKAYLAKKYNLDEKDLLAIDRIIRAVILPIIKDRKWLEFDVFWNAFEESNKQLMAIFPTAQEQEPGEAGASAAEEKARIRQDVATLLALIEKHKPTIRELLAKLGVSNQDHEIIGRLDNIISELSKACPNIHIYRSSEKDVLKLLDAAGNLISVAQGYMSRLKEGFKNYPDLVEIFTRLFTKTEDGIRLLKGDLVTQILPPAPDAEAAESAEAASNAPLTEHPGALARTILERISNTKNSWKLQDYFDRDLPKRIAELNTQEVIALLKYFLNVKAIELLAESESTRSTGLDCKAIYEKHIYKVLGDWIKEHVADHRNEIEPVVRDSAASLLAYSKDHELRVPVPYLLYNALGIDTMRDELMQDLVFENFRKINDADSAHSETLEIRPYLRFMASDPEKERYQERLKRWTPEVIRKMKQYGTVIYYLNKSFWHGNLLYLIRACPEYFIDEELLNKIADYAIPDGLFQGDEGCFGIYALQAIREAAYDPKNIPFPVGIYHKFKGYEKEMRNYPDWLIYRGEYLDLTERFITTVENTPPAVPRAPTVTVTNEEAVFHMLGIEPQPDMVKALAIIRTGKEITDKYGYNTGFARHDLHEEFAAHNITLDHAFFRIKDDIIQRMWELGLISYTDRVGNRLRLGWLVKEMLDKLVLPAVDIDRLAILRHTSDFRTLVKEWFRGKKIQALDLYGDDNSLGTEMCKNYPDIFERFLSADKYAYHGRTDADVAEFAQSQDNKGKFDIVFIYAPSRIRTGGMDHSIWAPALSVLKEGGLVILRHTNENEKYKISYCNKVNDIEGYYRIENKDFKGLPATRKDLSNSVHILAHVATKDASGNITFMGTSDAGKAEAASPTPQEQEPGEASAAATRETGGGKIEIASSLLPSVVAPRNDEIPVLRDDGIKVPRNEAGGYKTGVSSAVSRTELAKEHLRRLGADLAEYKPAKFLDITLTGRKRIEIEDKESYTNRMVNKVQELARILNSNIAMHAMPAEDLLGITRKTFSGGVIVLIPEVLRNMGIQDDREEAKKFIEAFLMIWGTTTQQGFRTRERDPENRRPAVPAVLFMEMADNELSYFKSGKNKASLSNGYFEITDTALYFDIPAKFEGKLLGLIQWQFEELDGLSYEHYIRTVGEKYIDKLLEIARNKTSSDTAKITGNNIPRTGRPIGDEGGYLNRLIDEARNALSAKRYREARQKALKALMLFRRYESLQDNPEELNKFLENLYEKLEEGYDISHFSRSEEFDAQSVFEEAGRKLDEAAEESPDDSSHNEEAGVNNLPAADDEKKTDEENDFSSLEESRDALSAYFRNARRSLIEMTRTSRRGFLQAAAAIMATRAGWPKVVDAKTSDREKEGDKLVRFLELLGHHNDLEYENVFRWSKREIYFGMKWMKRDDALSYFAKTPLESTANYNFLCRYKRQCADSISYKKRIMDIARKVMQGNAARGEEEELREALQMVRSYFASRRSGGDRIQFDSPKELKRLSSDKWSEATELFDSFPPEIQIKGLINLFEREMKLYEQLLNSVIQPGISTLQKAYRSLKKILSMDNTHSKSRVTRTSAREGAKGQDEIASPRSFGARNDGVRVPSNDAEKATQTEAERIHEENLKYMPDIQQKTILCHIVADSIVPEGQRSVLTNVEFAMRDKSYSEKVVRLEVDSSKDFTDEVRDKIQKVKNYYKNEYKDDFENYTFKFDVACPGTNFVKEILESDLGKEMGVKALAFEPCKEPAQVEGIMLALRALHSDRIESLRQVFEMLSGRNLSTKEMLITDVNEFVKTIIFILPKAKEIDYDDAARLNHIIRKNIKTSA